MSLAYWRDDCETNHPQIDEEHQDHVRILGMLHRAIFLNQDNSVINGILGQLFTAALSHCETEETLMDIYGYPNAEDHLEQHEELLSKILNLVLKVEQPDSKLTVDMAHDLVHWLTCHIADHDLQMAQFILEQQHLASEEYDLLSSLTNHPVNHGYVRL